MKRRTYLATVGSIAAGGAVTMGTGASVDVWADRTADVTVVSDTNGFVSLSPGEENGDLVSTNGGELSIDFSAAGGNGFNQGARSTVDDLFRIENQTGETQVFWIKDAAEGGPLGDFGPVNFFRGPVEATGGDRYQIVSAVSPVPGTQPTKQRLSITGLVPPAGLPVRFAEARGIAFDATPPADLDPSEGWIRAGNFVYDTVTGSIQFDADADVPLTGTAAPGEPTGGRLVLAPGEEMRVGVDVDLESGDDTTGQLVDQIQIVSRPVEDALGLTTDTEFGNS